MGRNCNGPKLTWADFVMGRNDPEPSVDVPGSRLQIRRAQGPGGARSIP